jgi:hypothetical protein
LKESPFAFWRVDCRDRTGSSVLKEERVFGRRRVAPDAAAGHAWGGGGASFACRRNSSAMV